jgi:PAS domain S-box-containing protein
VPESRNLARADLVEAIKQAADGVVITDTGGTIQYVNPAFTAMTGYTNQEAVGQNPRILKSGRQPAAFYENLWRAIRSGEIWQGELTNRRKDGTFYDEQMRIAPVRDSSGEIVSYIAIKHDVTERRAAEEARRFLAATVESSEDAIFALAPTGAILTWNRGAESLFGYSASEAIGRQVSMLAPPERQQLLAQLIERVLEGNAVSQYEGMCFRQDGRRFPVSVTVCPIRNSAGDVSAISAILRDISQRREDEKAQALLASIVESSEDAIHAATLDGTIVSWNRGAEILFGYSSREIVGKNIADTAPPGRRDEVRQCLETVRTGRTIRPFDTVRQRKDGREIDVSLSVSPIRNPTGEVVGASSIARDIGLRVRTERKLREGEELFGRVFENAPFGMCVSELDGRYLQVNAAFCRMLGYSEPELIGKTWPELTHVDDLESALRRLEQLLTGTAEYVEGERRYLHRGGHVVWGRDRISLVRDHRGRPLYSVVHVEDITERRRTENALRESEERFRIMADSCPMGIWVTDEQGGTRFINRRYREFSGVTSEQVEPNEWRSRIHPDDSLEFVGALQRALKEHAPFRTEGRHRRADGEWRWVESYAVPRFSSGGEFLGLVGTSKDITERKRAEEALRESEERFRNMADGCPEAMWVTSADGSNNFLNRACREFCGTNCEQVVKGNWQSMVHPEDAEEYLGAIQRAVREHTNFKGEARLRRADDEWRWVVTHAVPRFSQSGEYLGDIGLSLDITERKQAEQALRTSEEKFRQLAENIREVFWMMDPGSDKFLYISPAYEQVWGRTCDSVYRNSASRPEAIHPDDLERSRRLLARQMQGEPVENEYRIRTPDGQEKWIRSRAFPVRDEGGKLIRAVGIAEDITERKRYEAELIEAREGADAANRAKSCFLANMSHEIRTPMNGVIGMLQLLALTDLTKEQRHYAAVAQSSGQTLLALIDQILDLSRIEARQVTLENRSFNLRDVVAEVVQLLSVQANAKGLPIHCYISPEIPPLVVGDAHRLRQVLTNLTANAVKFTEQGVVALDAAMDAAMENQGNGSATVRFTVTDTGIGIRQSQAATLFSPFTQADVSTTRKYGGTGLGLAISKQIVEMMGGTIGVDSREGRGSAFWFTAVFELAPQPAPASERQDAPCGTPAEPAQEKAMARILVVEDNSTSREVALAQLRKLGYQASAVSNGADAVKAVESGRFGLVLMDCQMPVMDGFQAARRIRSSSQPAIAGIPIVAVTANAMKNDRERCLREGMNGYLAKPVKLEPLANALATWLPEPGAGDRPQTPGPPNEIRERTDQEKPAFNSESLLRRLTGDRRLAGKIVEGFLRDAPSEFQKLRTRLEDADAAGASLQAQALKGSAATVGAESLHAILRAIEQAGKGGELERCGELFPEVVEEFERFQSALKSAGWIGAGLEKEER